VNSSGAIFRLTSQPVDAAQKTITSVAIHGLRSIAWHPGCQGTGRKRRESPVYTCAWYCLVSPADRTRAGGGRVGLPGSAIVEKGSDT
jgi:hypothetical protein